MVRVQRDDNRVPAMQGIDAADFSTPRGVTMRVLASAYPLDVSIVDGSGNQITAFGAGIQYIDAAAAAAHPTGTGIIFNNGGTYNFVSAAQPLPITGTLTVGGTTDNSAFTAGTSTGTPALGFYHSTLDTVTDGRAATIAITAKRAMMVNLQNSTGTEIGTTTNPVQVTLANTGANTNKLLVTADPITFASAQAVTQSGTWNITNVSGTVSLPTGASTEASLAKLTLAQGSTTSGQSGTLMQGAVTTSAPSYTTAQTSPLSLDTGGGLRVNVQNGTIAVTQSGTWNVGTVTTISAARIVGNGGATIDSTVGAGTAPANQVVVGSIYSTTAPAPTNGQAMATQADQAGNLRIAPGIALATLSGWTSSTALNATQNIFTNSGAPAVLVQLVQGSTISAGAINFEVTYDNSNWVTVAANQVVDPTSTSLAQIALPYTLVASTNKPFMILTHGAQGLRIKLTTQIIGSATVTPNYALLPTANVSETVAYSPTAGNFKVDLSGTSANATAIKVDGSAVTQPISGSVTVTQGTGTNLHSVIDSGTVTTVSTVTSLSQLAGAAIAMNTGTRSAGTQRVTIATDDVVPASQSGTWTVQPGNTANTTAWKVDNSAVTQPVGGTVATNVAITANPVNLGAQAVSSENTAVTTARQVQLVADLVGKLIVLPYANPENFVSGAITTAMTSTTSTSLIAAPAAGLRNYITQITVSNAHATVGTDVIIQDGSGGTTLYTIPAAAVYGGAVVTFPTPLRQPTTATAIYCANVTTGASTKVSASGYKGV